MYDAVMYNAVIHESDQDQCTNSYVNSAIYEEFVLVPCH